MFRAAKEWKRLENDVTTCEEPCGVRFQIGKKEVKKRSKYLWVFFFFFLKSRSKRERKVLIAKEQNFFEIFNRPSNALSSLS